MLKVINRNGVLYLSGTVSGKRIRKSTDLRDTKEHRKLAERMRLDMELEAMEGGPGKADALFGEVVDAYERRVEGVSRGSLGYLKRLRVAWKGWKISMITPKAIEDYVARMHDGSKPGTVRRDLAMLRAVVNYGAERGMCERIKVIMPKVDDARVRWLTEAERERLLTQAMGMDGGVYQLLLFLFYTGARLGEALRAEAGDVGPAGVTLESRKGGRIKKRVVPVHRRLAGKLNENGKLLVLANVSRSEIYRRFRLVLEASGIEDFKLHDCRHTFASHLAMKTGDLGAIKELLGHESMAMTMRYAHLAHAHLKDRVEVL